VGSALGRLESRLEGREVAVRLAPAMPLVLLDDVLIELVLFNLVENALKYTPSGSPIEIGARLGDGALLVEVADRGPGLPPGQEESVFEKFYRGRREGDPSGVGLGLSICRGILEAHGGAILAANREGGGSVFRIMLPQSEHPPAVTPEEALDAGDTTGLEPS
jgi:two-component system sensor histidine kinase KdpD